MTPRRKLIAGNIKMFLTVTAVGQLVREVQVGLNGRETAEVAYFPPFTMLADTGRLLAGGPIALGAQDVFWEDEGAFTGQISARMLLDVGCHFALIGHSERRQYFGETDETVRRKIVAALRHGLLPIVCVGETLVEREAGKAVEVLARQLDGATVDLDQVSLSQLTIAYEPVWAIGTSLTATPEQAEEAHHAIRERLDARQPGLGLATRILYGGSVKADNAAGLFARPGIDGALVGGACLSPASFLAIIRAAG
ncbi:MAG: triose-phosphate isomerase [Candidatus Eisenbacteria bacterium]|nr:triose-phosphate isomerase [Candidatus Eisenbacteria bacterium]